MTNLIPNISNLSNIKPWAIRVGLTVLGLSTMACSGADKLEEGDTEVHVAASPNSVFDEDEGTEETVTLSDQLSLSASNISEPEDRSQKIAVVTLNFSPGGNYTLDDPRILYGNPPNYFGDSGEYELVLNNASNEVLGRFPIPNPRWIMVWDHEKQRDSVEIQDSGELEIPVRIMPGGQNLILLKDGETAADIDLAGAFDRFCREIKNEDRDCRPDNREEPRPDDIQ